MSGTTTRWARRVHNDGRGFCEVYTSPDGQFEISDELTQPTAQAGPWAPWSLAKRDDAGNFIDVCDDDGYALQFKSTEAAKRHAATIPKQTPPEVGG